MRNFTKRLLASVLLVAFAFPFTPMLSAECCVPETFEVVYFTDCTAAIWWDNCTGGVAGYASAGDGCGALGFG